MRVGALIAVFAGVLALAVAGCGGSSAPSAEETWAAGVCTSVATWKTNVEAITQNAANALTKPGATRKDVETAIDEGVTATQTLVGELRASTPPDTAEGKQARAQVSAFLAQAQTSVDNVKKTVASLPDAASLVQVITKLSGLASDLQSTLQSGLDLVKTLPEIGGNLKAGFEHADSCKQLRSASS